MEENILEALRTLPHVFGSDLIVTILMVFMRIRLKSPISKHWNILWNSVPINELIPLFTSLTRIDHLRSIGELWETLWKCIQRNPSSLTVVSLIVLSRGEKESVLYEFEKFSYHLSESTKFDLFHDVWEGENILEHWETYPHLFVFDLCVTILMAIMRISLKSPISKHSHIFWNSTPIDKLILFYSSLTSRDYFRSIGELWLTFQ